MKKATIVVVMMALLLSACAPIAPMVPISERYANELAGNQLLAKHAAYFRSEYSSTTKDEAFWAYRAILEGELLAVQYDLALKTLNKEKDDKSIISDLKMVKQVLISQLANYSEVWSAAIHEHVRYKYSSVDFSTALYITKKEYSRIGIFSKVNTIKEKLKGNISNLDKQKYQKTYELYAIVSQLIDLSEEPKGSLMTFNSTVNSLNTDFSKTLAIAELEF